MSILSTLVNYSKQLTGPSHHSAYPQRSLNILTKQLAMLVNAGLPLAHALTSMLASHTNVGMLQLLKGLQLKILAGYSLASAMRHYGHIFKPQYCAIIAAGEQSGTLARSLSLLANYTEQLAERRAQLSSLLIYPSILLLLSILIIIVALYYIVPETAHLYTMVQETPPPIIKFIIAATAYSTAVLWTMLGMISLIALMIIFIRQRRGNYRWLAHYCDQCLLRLPLIAKIVVTSNLVRYLHTMGTLLSAGLPLHDCLTGSIATISNQVMQSALSSANRQITAGINIYRAYEHTQYFSPMVIQLLASASLGGNLAETLLYLAKHEESVLNSLMTTTLRLLEPLLIMLMSVIISVILFSVFSPLLNLDQLIDIGIN